MARADPGPVIPMEVLVEKDVVPPVGICLELFPAPVHRPPPVRAAEEDADETIRDLLGGFEKVHRPAR